jgi:hypothetical protein
MVKPLPLDKTYSTQNLYLSTKPFYTITKPLFLGKIFVLHGSQLSSLGETFPSWGNLCTSWLNLYLLTKPFYIMAPPLPLGKTFLFG